MTVKVKAVAICGLFLIAGAYGGYVVSRIGEKNAGEAGDVRITRQSGDRTRVHRKDKTPLENNIKTFSEKNLKDLAARLQKGMTQQEICEEMKNLFGFLPDSFVAIGLLAEESAKMDPAAILNELARKESKDDRWWRHYAQTQILKKWSNYDPVGAATFYIENKADFSNDNRVEADMMESLVKESPNEAWKWLKKLNPQGTGEQVAIFFQELARIQPEQIEKFVNRINISTQDGRLAMRNIFVIWAESDVESAENWLQSQPDNYKKNFDTILIGAMVLKDREKAVEMYEKMDNSDKSNALGKIRESMLSKYSYQETADFILSIQSEEGDGWVSQSLYHQWLYTEPVKFREWIQKLPEGANRDSALSVYSQKNSFLDYEEATAFINSISDEQTRNSSINNILRRWQKEDPEQMKAWVEKSDLPEEKKQQWLKEK